MLGALTRFRDFQWCQLPWKQFEEKKRSRELKRRRAGQSRADRDIASDFRVKSAHRHTSIDQLTNNTERVIHPTGFVARTQFRKRNLNFPEAMRVNLNHPIITTAPGDVNPAINCGAQHYAFIVISVIAEKLDPAWRMREKSGH